MSVVSLARPSKTMKCYILLTILSRKHIVNPTSLTPRTFSLNPQIHTLSLSVSKPMFTPNCVERKGTCPSRLSPPESAVLAPVRTTNPIQNYERKRGGHFNRIKNVGKVCSIREVPLSPYLSAYPPRYLYISTLKLSSAHCTGCRKTSAGRGSWILRIRRAPDDSQPDLIIQDLGFLEASLELLPGGIVYH